MTLFSPRHITRFLILITLCFTFASVVGSVITYWPANPLTYPYGPTFPIRNRYIEWFSLDLDHTIPAWYTSALFLAGAAVLSAVAWTARHRVYSQTPYWVVLGIVFLNLSMSKAIKTHNLLPEPIRLALDNHWTIWIITGLCFFLVFFRFLIRLNTTTRLSFILSGILLAGSFGTDRIGGVFAAEHSGHHMVAALLGDAEGTLEMMSAVLLIYGAMVQLRRQRLRAYPETYTLDKERARMTQTRRAKQPYP